MTARQERVAKLVVNLTVSAVMLSILAAMAWPGLRDRFQVGGQWARYYRWRAWWMALPEWAREAAIVRGKGPAEE